MPRSDFFLILSLQIIAAQEPRPRAHFDLPLFNTRKRRRPAWGPCTRRMPKGMRGGGRRRSTYRARGCWLMCWRWRRRAV